MLERRKQLRKGRPDIAEVHTADIVLLEAVAESLDHVVALRAEHPRVHWRRTQRASDASGFMSGTGVNVVRQKLQPVP